MKLFFLTTAVFSAFFTYSQTELKTKLAGDNTLGIGYELGGGLQLLDDEYMLNPLEDRIELKEHLSSGLTCFYEHQFNFTKRHGLTLGLGFNATIFRAHITYENPEPGSSMFLGDELIYGTNTKRYDLGKQKLTYFAIDLPILYNFTASAKNNWNIAPYIGVKFRNVVYVTGEGRNRSPRETTKFEGQYSVDTIYHMSNRISGGMKNQRIIILPTIGIKVSKVLANGAKLNFFADYSIGVLNQVEAYYSHFKSTEKVETAHGPGTNSYEMMYFSEERTLFLTLKMSHFRAGLSYTLRHR